MDRKCLASGNLFAEKLRPPTIHLAGLEAFDRSVYSRNREVGAMEMVFRDRVAFFEHVGTLHGLGLGNGHPFGHADGRGATMLGITAAIGQEGAFAYFIPVDP